MIRQLMTRPIVMIGLMGAGKTKIGGLLAAALELPFVDADHEIEQTAQLSIADIFTQYGEQAFRDLERKVLARLMSDELQVIATGGGAVMNDETATLVWDSATSIWLKGEVDVLVERTGRAAGKRPLLQNGDPRTILQDLMDKRYPTYAKADITVETGPVEAEETLDHVIGALEKYLSSQKAKA